MITAIIFAIVGFGGYFALKPFLTKIFNLGGTVFSALGTIIKLLPVFTIIAVIIYIIVRFAPNSKKKKKKK